MPKKIKTSMRRFYLERSVDVNNTSGTGYVAEGIEFSDGMCALTWHSEYHAVTVFENIKSVEQIHGHEGKTKIIFID